MKSLERELHCSVCKDIVKQPVVLPCQHSVCLLCASEVLVANGYPPPELPPEPNSPASTPNMRSPRQARRPTPKHEQRPIDRVLRAGMTHLLIHLGGREKGYNTINIYAIWKTVHPPLISLSLRSSLDSLLGLRSPPSFPVHASISRIWVVSRATPQGRPTTGDAVPLCALRQRCRAGRKGPH